ncbi:DUF302 domain-containing protein [Ollibium composti]|uniref:DUF302 domain-containing protein n=1 Tax=Ollibium composti TaxID=2675109 RepID=A0ABY2Q5Q9_9HYPH|nr:DUF302 domain-containing protein [Mesorhizobium composti]THF55460.1 DUF302 domain-containing protein [Mesorhizobium composti]
MSYYFSKVLTCDFDKTVERVTLALKGAGFGIITEIDVRETFKRKLNADFRNYRILGACNPTMAREALEIEDKIGTMLPCNVVVQDMGDGHVEVAAVDPVASMAAVGNPTLLQVADRVREMLKSVVESL